jgi:peptidyl-prolyl cis-trans isomerase SurA
MTGEKSGRFCMKRIFMIVIAISSIFITASYGGIEIDKIVAIVNNEAITLSELEKIVLIESKEALKGLSGEKKAKAEEKLRKEILKELIERRLQLQRARRSGIVVSKEEVKEAIEDIKKKNSLNDAEFEKTLAKENMTLKEYEDQLRDQLIMAKLVNQEVRSKVVIGDNDIASYYERNKKDFFLGEQVKLSHIFLKLSDKAAEEERNNIKETIDRISGKLRSGEDFAVVAKAYSHGPTASSGGSLGFLKRGEIAPELEEVAFSLKEGEISDPIWTRGGVHILKIESKVENKYKPLEVVAEEIRKILIEKEMKNIYREWISGMRENSFIEIRL